MATIQEVVESRLNRYHIELDAVELDVMIANAGLAAADIYTSAHDVTIKTAFVSIIPELLLMPDVSDEGYSRKWSRESIIAYYKILRSELGLDMPTETAQPTIKNASNFW